MLLQTTFDELNSIIDQKTEVKGPSLASCPQRGQ